MSMSCLGVRRGVIGINATESQRTERNQVRHELTLPILFFSIEVA